VTNTLILGGTGKTGRRIAARLRVAGHAVRTASRAGSDVHLDLSDAATWPPALAGATTAYLVEPDVGAAAADPHARLPRFVDHAVTAGVRRLVLLTAGGAGDARHPLAPAERAVRGSGVGWTILRPGWFAQNFSESFWRAGVMSGTLTLPTGAGRTPFVDADDIADVAVAALTGERHHGEIYPLTGARAIDFAEATDLVGRAIGRTVRHRDVDAEAFVEQQVAGGFPRAGAQSLAVLYGSIRSGDGAEVADGIDRALGRAPRSFEDFAIGAAVAGHWRRLSEESRRTPPVIDGPHAGPG